MEYIYVDENSIGRVELIETKLMNELEIKKKALNHLPVIGRKNKIPKMFRRYNLEINKSTYITINQKTSVHKILKIETLKDFDKFNEKYCIIEELNHEIKGTKDETKVYGSAIINWDIILKQYGGIYISSNVLGLQYLPQKYKIDKKDRLPNGTKYNYKIDERDRWGTLPIKGKRYYSWIDRWVYSSGNAFIIWNINTIKKCKYVDTVPDKIFHIGLPKA